MQDTNHGHDQWQQSVNRELSDLRDDLNKIEAEQSLDTNWRIAHMTECHPKILYRLAMILGGMVGLAAVVGYVLGSIFPLLPK